MKTEIFKERYGSGMNIHKVKAQYVASGGGFTTAILQLYATPVHNTCRAFNAIINSLQN